MRKDSKKHSTIDAKVEVKKVPTAKETMMMQPTVQEEFYSIIETENTDTYYKFSISIPKKMHDKVEDFVLREKKLGVTMIDPIHKLERKISKSSWIAEAIEEKIKRDGIDLRE